MEKLLAIYVALVMNTVKITKSLRKNLRVTASALNTDALAVSIKTDEHNFMVVKNIHVV